MILGFCLFLQPMVGNTHGGTLDASGAACAPKSTPSSTPSAGTGYNETEITTTTTEATTCGAQATCGQEYFTKIEDRPQVIERKVGLNL